MHDLNVALRLRGSVLLAGFACFVFAGCTSGMMLVSAKNARLMVDGPAPVSADYSQQIGDSSFEEERYGKVPILDASNSYGGIPPTIVGIGGAFAHGNPYTNTEASSNLPDVDAEHGNTPAQKRLIVYSARFKVAPPNVDDAILQFRKLVDDVGGYLESRENSRLVSRVPADRFDDVVAFLPSLGTVKDQHIKNRDVTNQHRDLALRIETAQWSRKRVLALLEKANELQDVLKLENELRKLTELIETMTGEYNHLSEEVAFSRIDVSFDQVHHSSEVSKASGVSLFPWINSVGVDHVLRGFKNAVLSDTSTKRPFASLFTSAVPIDAPGNFLVIDRQRNEMKAATADEAKLWFRRFVVNQRANLEFWSKALSGHLTNHRGYALVDEKSVLDKQGREGVELTFDTQHQGNSNRYVVMLFVDRGSFFSPKHKIRLIEFLAPRDKFDSYLEDVRAATIEPVITDAEMIVSRLARD